MRVCKQLIQLANKLPDEGDEVVDFSVSSFTGGLTSLPLDAGVLTLTEAI